MTAATLFSGIGAPETSMPDWEWLWSAEIEKFPSAVLAERFPHTVNLGDVTADDFAERALAIGRPDVLVFGSPCQSFSVAGKRLGLDDARGNLALVALGIVARIKPKWFVFENVPGLLSSAGGSDFGVFLRAVEDCGYFGAWSVLDAQYFGVAQRRNRVFFVGCLGDWRGPAAVLLEPDSLCGDSAPSRAAGQGTTHSVEPSLVSSGRGVERTGETRGQDPVVACEAFVSNAEGSDGFTLTRANIGKHVNNQTPLIAHALRGEGFDASEDGIGRGTPLVPVGFDSYNLQETGDVMQTLKSPQGGITESIGAIRSHTGVRRLMPVECERLQGFPDGHTAITYPGKPAADGPRYKAIGNSMAVPVLQWILSRIAQVDAILGQERET